MAVSFRDFIDRARPRWTYPKGPGSRADFMAEKAPTAPRLKFRTSALLFGEGKPFFAEDRPRKVYSAGLEASPAPDPALLLARQSRIEAPLSGRYAEVERSLRAEMRALDSVEMGNASIIAADLGRALLDRVIASSTEGLARMALWGTALGAVAFGAGFWLRASSGAALDPFGYGAIYFAAGLVGAVFIAAAALAAGASAKRDFAKGADNLAALVERTTGEFRTRLLAMRAAMRPKAGEFGEAIAAASQARMTTIAAMRFFSQAPALGSEGEGHQSSVLAENLQRAAKARLASGLVSAGVFSALLAAAAVAAFFALPSARLALGQFAAAEAARAGIVLLPMAVAALLAFPLLAGPLLAAMRAAGNPGAVLKSEPARSMADGLKASALAAAAETENDMIAGYADALGALESKAGALSHSAGDGAAWGWRRAPEAPRFVGVGFQSAPPAFTTDAPRIKISKFFRGPRPKRG